MKQKMGTEEYRQAAQLFVEHAASNSVLASEQAERISQFCRLTSTEHYRLMQSLPEEWRAKLKEVLLGAPVLHRYSDLHSISAIIARNKAAAERLRQAETYPYCYSIEQFETALLAMAKPKGPERLQWIEQNWACVNYFTKLPNEEQEAIIQQFNPASITKIAVHEADVPTIGMWIDIERGLERRRKGELTEEEKQWEAALEEEIEPILRWNWRTRLIFKIRTFFGLNPV